MKQVFGGILLAVGILIAGASGLCSLVVLGSMLGNSADAMAGLPMVLLFGGVPFAIGLGLFFLGRSMLKRPESDPMGSYPSSGPADRTDPPDTRGGF
jgi:hypothetical protein